MAEHPARDALGLQDLLLGQEGVSVADYLAALEAAGSGSASAPAAAPDAFAPCPCLVEGCDRVLTSRRDYYRHLEDHGTEGAAAVLFDQRRQGLRRGHGAAAGSGGSGAGSGELGPSGGDGGDGNSGGGGNNCGGDGNGAGGGDDSGGGGGGELDSFGQASPLPSNAAAGANAALHAEHEADEAAAAAAAALLDGSGDGWLADASWGELAAALEQDFGREAALQLLASLVQETAADSANSEEEEQADGDDDLDEQEGAEGAGGDSIGRRAASFYRDRLLQPLYKDAQVSLLQTAHLLLSWKRRFNLKDEHMEEMCRSMAEVLLPQPNIMAPSLYMLMKVRAGAARASRRV